MATAKGRRPDQLPGGRHGLDREYVASSQRQRLLDAMLEEVGQRGYHATRVADVIRGAGVSNKTFYELFSDKEDCFIAAYDYAVGHLVSETAGAYEQSSGVAPWPERVRRGVA